MKLMPSILVFSLSGIVLPAAGVGHQGFGNELGQKVSHSSETIGGNKPWSVPYYYSIMVQARAAQTSNQELYGTMGVCYVSPTLERINPDRDAQGSYSLSVIENADNIFFNGPHMPRLVLNLENAEITVLQPPKHGILNRDLHTDTNIYKDVFSYYPNARYVGNDKAEFLVNIEGYKIKVVYFIKVDALYDIDHPDFSKCPNPNPWKISSDSPAAPGSSDLLLGKMHLP